MQRGAEGPPASCFGSTAGCVWSPQTQIIINQHINRAAAAHLGRSDIPTSPAARSEAEQTAHRPRSKVPSRQQGTVPITATPLARGGESSALQHGALCSSGTKVSSAGSHQSTQSRVLCRAQLSTGRLGAEAAGSAARALTPTLTAQHSAAAGQPALLSQGEHPAPTRAASHCRPKDTQHCELCLPAAAALQAVPRSTKRCLPAPRQALTSPAKPAPGGSDSAPAEGRAGRQRRRPRKRSLAPFLQSAGCRQPPRACAVRPLQTSTQTPGASCSSQKHGLPLRSALEAQPGPSPAPPAIAGRC